MQQFYFRMDFTFRENQDVIASRRNILLNSIKRIVNRFFKLFNIRLELTVPPDGTTQMITLEQCMNMYHLVDQVLAYGVEGDLIELGCHTGESAMQIQMLNRDYGYQRKLHVYDRFNMVEDTVDGIRQKLVNRFQFLELRAPEIHEGFFSETIPSQLPDQIAFAHIDIGCGDDQQELQDSLLKILEAVYSRLSEGGICLLADYHDPMKTRNGTNSNPGVKLACDEFFKLHDGSVNVLFGNHYSHGFFRKSNSFKKNSFRASGNNSVLQTSREMY